MVRWVPPPPPPHLKVATICYRSWDSEFLWWATVDEATQSLAELATPKCHRRCLGIHATCHADHNGVVHTKTYHPTPKEGYE